MKCDLVTQSGGRWWNFSSPGIGSKRKTGETYTLAPGMSRVDALAFRFAKGHIVLVAKNGSEILGRYIRALTREVAERTWQIAVM